jgi:hypothetical protein
LAIGEVMIGKVTSAFVAIRPPDHHVETWLPMHFCFFNNTVNAPVRADDTGQVFREAMREAVLPRLTDSASGRKGRLRGSLREPESGQKLSTSDTTARTGAKFIA